MCVGRELFNLHSCWVSHRLLCRPAGQPPNNTTARCSTRGPCPRARAEEMGTMQNPFARSAPPRR